MSHSSNQIVSIWKDVEAQLRCITPTRNRRRLPPHDAQLHRDVISLTGLAWSDLITSSGGTFSDIRRWTTTVAQLDVLEWCEIFKSGSDLLLSEIGQGRIPDYATFKQSLSHIPRSGAVMGPLKGVFAQLDERPEEVFSILHCALSFPLRVSYNEVGDLRASALVEYLDREAALAGVLPTSEEASIIGTWFPRSDKALYQLYADFEPKHGGGYVAEGTRSKHDKYTMLGTDPLLRYLDNKLGDRVVTPRPRGSFDRRSRVTFVAKTATKLRTICMEPATLMWYQQGFLRSINLAIGSNAYLRRRIDFEDQGRNRQLAMEGSLAGDYATIDLSAASDSVSWNLVKAWFYGSSLREVVTATRSRTSELPDHSIIRTQKFAPMGSALCFPIESIVFSAITEAAIVEAGGNPIASRYRVYGDDIIVESEYVEALNRRLAANGFSVNHRKSFTAGGPHYFRESCGGEYLNMTDVTPTRIPRKFRGLTCSVAHPESIMGLIEFANDSYSRLPSVRRRIVSQLLELPKKLRPIFDSEGLTGLFSPATTNHHLDRLHSIDWQRDTTVCGTTHHQSKVRKDGEDIRLFEYLRSTAQRERLLYPEDRVDVQMDPPVTSKWVSHTI